MYCSDQSLTIDDWYDDDDAVIKLLQTKCVMIKEWWINL